MLQPSTWKRYELYCQEAKIDSKTYDNKSEISPVVSDDEEENTNSKPPSKCKSNYEETWTSSNTTILCGFDLDGPKDRCRVIPSKAATSSIGNEKDMTNASRALLQAHYKMAHMPMSKLQEMAKQGMLPSNLAKCEIPLCMACTYAKQERRAWRHKSTIKRNQPNQER